MSTALATKTTRIDPMNCECVDCELTGASVPLNKALPSEMLLVANKEAEDNSGMSFTATYQEYGTAIITCWETGQTWEMRDADIRFYTQSMGFKSILDAGQFADDKIRRHNVTWAEGERII